MQNESNDNLKKSSTSIFDKKSSTSIFDKKSSTSTFDKKLIYSHEQFHNLLMGLSRVQICFDEAEFLFNVYNDVIPPDNKCSQLYILNDIVLWAKKYVKRIRIFIQKWNTMVALTQSENKIIEHKVLSIQKESQKFIYFIGYVRDEFEYIPCEFKYLSIVQIDMISRCLCNYYFHLVKWKEKIIILF